MFYKLTISTQEIQLSLKLHLGFNLPMRVMIIKQEYLMMTAILILYFNLNISGLKTINLHSDMLKYL